MKYLKKYTLFENIDNDDLLDEVKSCFADFIDNNQLDVDYDESRDVIYLEFSFEEPKTGRTTINNVSDILNKNYNNFEDIKVSLLRLKDVYPDLIETIEMYDNSFSSFIITIFKEKPEEGAFYQKRGNEIILDEEKLKNILELDKDVKISIWSTGDKQLMKFSFKDPKHFLTHCYREYIDNRQDMRNARGNEDYWDNSSVEGAFIIKPELMTQYQKLGKNFDKLKIDGENMFTNEFRVKVAQSENSYVNGNRQSMVVTNVSVYLNKKFEFDI